MVQSPDSRLFEIQIHPDLYSRNDPTKWYTPPTSVFVTELNEESLVLMHIRFQSVFNREGAVLKLYIDG